MFIFILIVVVLCVLSVPAVRRTLITRHLFAFVKKQKSRISPMEKQALTAGIPGFEKTLFSGRPDWAQLRALPPLKLREDEESVIRGPVSEVCRAVDDWDIRYKKREIPDSIWQLVMKHRLFGLRVPKERGGFSLSFQAQSLILGMIATRSVDVATLIELPTSLWPDEIVEKYGTEEQKQYWMPRFADNKEIISFAVTGISNGSDATSMRDVGVVEYGTHNGEKVLGIRLNIAKRYITFAPKATLLVLGFQLMDPQQHLQKGTDIGISLALIPAAHPGIEIGRRHLPTNVAFPNGPIWGKDVFIPVEWLIGGPERAGTGWKMIMECLFVGRAIALPSISVAITKLATRTSAMYARVRRQFGSHIGRFEGIEEPLARLAEASYISESLRSLTTSMVDSGFRPLAVSSLMKYRTTEIARHAVNDAIDIHAGRGIQDGPSNYLMSGYLAVPIGVTVEGANIVTRAIITFAQGILQTHPYLYTELECCEDPDPARGLKRFDAAVLGHVRFLISNLLLSLWHGLTMGRTVRTPQVAGLNSWYQALGHASIRFAFLSDVTALFMAGLLKKRQKLGGRLADALSELYTMAAVLKRYEDDGLPQSDAVLVRLSMQGSLYRFEQALRGALRNYPVVWLRPILTLFLFPLGYRSRPPSDALTHTVAELLQQPSDTLERLTRYVFISKDPTDITGRLEHAFELSVKHEALLKKLDLAIRAGQVKRVLGVDWIASAVDQRILTAEEGVTLRAVEEAVEKALSVDHFDPKEIVLHA